MRSYILLLQLLIFCFGGFCFANTNDSARVAAHTAYLTSTPETHRYTEKLVEEIKSKNIPLDKAVVELFHVGDEIPTSLDALTRSLYFAGIRQIEFKKVSSAEYEKFLEQQTDQYSETVPEVYKFLQYEMASDPTMQVVPAKNFKERFKDKLGDLKIRLKHFFGVPKGVTILSYYFKKDHRRPIETIVEGGTAFAKVAVSTYVIYHTLLRNPESEPMNIVLPVIISAAFTIFFDYMPRDNLDCKAQGRNFNFNTNTFEPNRKLYFFMSIVHSMLMRFPMMLAANIHSAEFTTGWSSFWGKVGPSLGKYFTETLGSSLRSSFAKSPFEIVIQRMRAYMSKWAGIGMIAAWGTFYCALTVLDLYNYPHVRSVLFYTALAGLGLDLFVKNRSDLPDFFRKLRRIVARRKNNCLTYLKVRES